MKSIHLSGVPIKGFPHESVKNGGLDGDRNSQLVLDQKTPGSYSTTMNIVPTGKGLIGKKETGKDGGNITPYLSEITGSDPIQKIVATNLAMPKSNGVETLRGSFGALLGALLPAREAPQKVMDSVTRY